MISTRACQHAAGVSEAPRAGGSPETSFTARSTPLGSPARAGPARPRRKTAKRFKQKSLASSIFPPVYIQGLRERTWRVPKPEADAAPALDDADMADAAPAPAAMPGQRRRILRFLNIPAFPSGGEPCLCTAGEFLRAQHGPSRFYVSRQPPRLLLREDASRFSPAWNRPVVFGR